MRSPTNSPGHQTFMQEAIRLARRSLEHAEDGGPFGAVIVQQGRIVSRGWNQVMGARDPTAHAEVVAIRAACRRLRRVHLPDCVLYTSCEPCPMCLAAIYWARLGEIYFSGTRRDAARIGFQDRHLYQELRLPRAKREIPTRRLLPDEARRVMLEWAQQAQRVIY
jgi:tRNA(Arg) A34 adenosine deaminase TadA